MNKLIIEFKNLGLIVDNPILDGGIKRCGTESHPKSKNGWYRGGSKFAGGKDIIWCTAGDWSQGDGALLNYKSWKDDNNFSAADREAIQKQQAESQQKFEAEKIKRYKEAAKTAQQQWLSYSEEGESQYLKDKGVQAHGVRFNHSEKDGNLTVIPVRDYANHIKSLQFVYDVKPDWLKDSNKHFW